MINSDRHEYRRMHNLCDPNGYEWTLRVDRGERFEIMVKSKKWTVVTRSLRSFGEAVDKMEARLEQVKNDEKAQVPSLRQSFRSD